MPSRCALNADATEVALSINAPAGRSMGRNTAISLNMDILLLCCMALLKSVTRIARVD